MNTISKAAAFSTWTLLGVQSATSPRSNLRGLQTAHLTTCSDNVVEFTWPSTMGDCADSMMEFQTYEAPLPDANGELTIDNDTTWYDCPDSNLLIMRSNDIPEHSIILQNPNKPCSQNIHVEYPRTPTLLTNQKTEASYILGFALNGVVAFNALEGDNSNAVEPSTTSATAVTDAQYWYGHSETTGIWHYHSPYMGQEDSTDYLNSTLQLGVAMDGFPIFGALDDTDSAAFLDECNFDSENGRYHIRSTDQVDESLDYCNGDDEGNNWNYIIGCYKGNVASSTMKDSSETSLPADCVAIDSIQDWYTTEFEYDTDDSEATVTEDDWFSTEFGVDDDSVDNDKDSTSEYADDDKEDDDSSLPDWFADFQTSMSELKESQPYLFYGILGLPVVCLVICCCFCFCRRGKRQRTADTGDKVDSSLRKSGISDWTMDSDM